MHRRLLACAALLAAPPAWAPQLYEVPRGVETRWYSFENPDGRPGGGGRTQEGRKGAPSRSIAAGETVVLADVAGPGVVRRIWLTVPGQVETLRGWVVRMYWDGQDWPSVENESPKAAPLFYDVDVTVGDALPADLAYFHARYRRENPTTTKRDFEVLPRVAGRGRYLGANVGVRATQHRRPAWFGEGELKIYVDGDREWPTLVGTGTEDLVGSAWGLGRFAHLYQGAPLSDERDGVWGFYRYHVPDPVYFMEAIRVTLQQIAGASVSDLRRLPEADRPELVRNHRRFDPSAYSRPEDEAQWENFETPQDVCATAYWYQALPSPRWPAREAYADRVGDLGR